MSKNCLEKFTNYMFGPIVEEGFFDIPQDTEGKKFSELSPQEREFLLEPYRRCQAFWRHWTPTIWSIPSVAAAINAAFYVYLFAGVGKTIDSVDSLVLSIPVVLNFALTVGASKHRYMQHRFGSRVMEIEQFAGIRPVKFKGLEDRSFSGGFWYVGLLLVLYVLSSCFLVQSMPLGPWQTAAEVILVVFGIFATLLAFQLDIEKLRGWSKKRRSQKT